jgi:hypothetical protein
MFPNGVTKPSTCFIITWSRLAFYVGVMARRYGLTRGADSAMDRGAVRPRQLRRGIRGAVNHLSAVEGASPIGDTDEQCAQDRDDLVVQ